MFKFNTPCSYVSHAASVQPMSHLVTQCPGVRRVLTVFNVEFMCGIAVRLLAFYATSFSLVQMSES